MNEPDVIEFYLAGTEKVICRIHSSHSPLLGDLVSVAGVTYKVKARNFAIDRSGVMFESQARLAVELEKTK
jgi:hypothetical protein